MEIHKESKVSKREMCAAHPSSENISSLYERHAFAWDMERGRSLMERHWLNDFLSVCGPDAAILDIGCRAGEPIARYLISAGGNVTGIDSSPTLIKLCEERFPKHSWRVADMRSLALGKKFDGILAWDSFFHLTPDSQKSMFPIFHAHAKPGAALMFTSGPSHGESIGMFKGEQLYHASLSASEYVALLTKEGFTVLQHKENDPECGGHTVWLARYNG